MSKEKLIKGINAEVAACVKCRLWNQRRHAVPGDGNIKAEIMFIGEAPGRQEDLRGLPFVGAAGKIFDELLHNIGLSRKKVYITNIVKCRPPGNRDPTSEEITTCTGLYLNCQVQIIRPKFLVMLGRHSAAFVLSKAETEVGGITKIHGRVYEINPFGFPVIAIPVFHPAAALYNIKYKDLLEEDFWVLKSEIEKHG
ncbi:MAG: uracil-DNA glycosylase [Candidatus Bathyarchaeota archaeon]|nr:uracil-DNA glycosylase [Candidatus Bathyarchaeota archaeon]MDH5495492.1 uracil-DNA glycosylase [Candidatus Bathyarchaeota archaeon]